MQACRAENHHEQGSGKPPHNERAADLFRRRISDQDPQPPTGSLSP